MCRGCVRKGGGRYWGYVDKFSLVFTYDGCRWEDLAGDIVYYIIRKLSSQVDSIVKSL